MNHGETLRQLDQLIQSRSILDHPFYRAWQSGALNQSQLAVYASSYYPHVEAFPRYLRSAIAQARDEIVRTELENNLADELYFPAPHHELWMDFAEGLGVKRDALTSTAPTESTKRTLDVFHQLASGETAGAISALYTYEAQQPAVSKTKMEGLQKFYGFIDKRTLAYFEVHAEKDVEHSDGERKAMVRCLERGASSETIFRSASTALDAYWGLLDGICKEAGVSDKC